MWREVRFSRAYVGWFSGVSVPISLNFPVKGCSCRPGQEETRSLARYPCATGGGRKVIPLEALNAFAP